MRAVRILAVTALTIGVGAACGTDPGESVAAATPTTVTTTTVVHDMPGIAGMDDMDGMPMPVAVNADVEGCAQHMPGDLLTADEAVVRFDRQMVCLGYVTVTTDTPVTWTNTDDLEHTVTIVDADDVQVAEFTVAAGESLQRPADTVGITTFTLTAIPSFVGTVEVQAAN